MGGGCCFVGGGWWVGGMAGLLSISPPSLTACGLAGLRIGQVVGWPDQRGLPRPMDLPDGGAAPSQNPLHARGWLPPPDPQRGRLPPPPCRPPDPPRIWKVIAPPDPLGDHRHIWGSSGRKIGSRGPRYAQSMVWLVRDLCIDHSSTEGSVELHSHSVGSSPLTNFYRH